MRTSHPTGVQIPSVESIDQWAATFSAIYTIKDQNMVNLGEIRLPSTGIAVEVIKITPEMLRQDYKLAGDVRQLAERGLVGFATTDTNVIHFRKDIALQLQDVRQFRVYNHSNLQSSHMEDNFQVEGIDELAYSKLANLHTESHEKAEKEKKKHEKLAHETHVSHRIHHAPATVPVTSHKVSSKPRVHAEAKTITAKTTQRATYNKARKKAEAKRDEEKTEHEEIKREEKNREVLRKGIRDSHQRANRNFGDEKESITSASSRGEAAELATSKTEKKRKTAKTSQEPTKQRKKTKTI